MNFFKGDTIIISTSANEDITGWKIRAEIIDKSGNVSQIATANSGGSDAQINVTDASNGDFTLTWAKDETTDFEDTAYIEIERENADGQVETIFQQEIQLKKQYITWETPS